jgi:hypothetical protein
MIVHFSNEAWTPTTTASMLRKADDNPIINSGTMQDEVNVYPNPSADFVNVRMPNDVKNGEISILDLSGKVLFTEMVNRNIVNINTLLLSNGIYMIRIKTGETFLILNIFLQ